MKMRAKTKVGEDGNEENEGEIESGVKMKLAWECE